LYSAIKSEDTEALALSVAFKRKNSTEIQHNDRGVKCNSFSNLTRVRTSVRKKSQSVKILIYRESNRQVSNVFGGTLNLAQSVNPRVQNKQ